MKAPFVNISQAGGSQSFDLARLSKSKDVVDLCPNTLRTYNRAGLNFYRVGKVVFFSKSELEAFIRARAASPGAINPVTC